MVGAFAAGAGGEGGCGQGLAAGGDAGGECDEVGVEGADD